MGLPWRWCPSKATNLGGRGRQIFRGHLDLSRFGVVSGEIVCKKKRKKNWNIIHINYCSGHILLVSFSPYVRGRWTPSPGVQVESVNIRFCWCRHFFDPRGRKHLFVLYYHDSYPCLNNTSASFLIESVHLQKNHFNEGDSVYAWRWTPCRLKSHWVAMRPPRSTPVVKYV